MKFGVRLPNSGPLANRRNIAEIAIEADRLGFDSVWVHDHIVWGTEQHRTHLSAGSKEALSPSQRPNFYESVTTLAYVAGLTQNVRLGVAVLVLPLRNPVVLAKQLANLDVLSEGRLVVGVAPGAPNITRPEFEAVGASYDDRGRITDEYISVLRKIWDENLPSFSGSYANFKEIQVFPKPSQRLRILIGGGERGISPRALRRVVELGDGWIPAYLTPDEAARGIEDIHKAAQSKGRDAAGFVVSHEMFTAIDEDGSKAQEAASKSLGTNFVSQEEGLKRSLVGSPSEMVQKLEKYSEAGVDMTELKFIYSDIPAVLMMMKLFSKEVIPSF
jgi:probable F420-dependent oxidoreductase